MTKNFKVGITRDSLGDDGKLNYKDLGLDILDRAENVSYSFLDKFEPVMPPEYIKDVDGMITLSPSYNKSTFTGGAERLIALARLGVGYDNVDVEACNDSNVALFTARGTVNYPMAEATIGWMLALNHHIFIKDNLVRTGNWGDRNLYMGTELRDRTMGIVGVGGIGGTIVHLLKTFKMKETLAYDPYLSEEQATKLGVTQVDLNTLMRESDYISVNCPLVEETRNLIDAEQLAMMKPTAYLITTARGGIVNESALVEVLQKKKIAGAAVDVFEEEPTGENHPYAELDNVILAPHAIGWTDELFRDMGRMCCSQMVTLAKAEIPEGLINTEVLENPGFQEKLERFKE